MSFYVAPQSRQCAEDDAHAGWEDLEVGPRDTRARGANAAGLDRWRCSGSFPFYSP